MLAFRNQVRLSRPGSYFFGAGGGLGYGLPAAIGVQLAQPERPVVAVIGDGSAQYAIAALWSAVAHEVPLTVLDAAQRGVRDPQVVRRVRGRDGRARASTSPGLDSVAIASGYGMRARRVEGADELRSRARRRDRVGRAGADRGPRSRPACRWARSTGRGAARAGRHADRAGGAATRPPDRVPDSLAGGTPEPLRSGPGRRCSAPTACSRASPTSCATPPTRAPTG